MVNDKENGHSGEIELLLKRMDQLKTAKTNADMQQLSELQMQKYFLEVQNDQDCITSIATGNTFKETRQLFVVCGLSTFRN